MGNGCSCYRWFGRCRAYAQTRRQTIDRAHRLDPFGRSDKRDRRLAVNS